MFGALGARPYIGGLRKQPARRLTKTLSRAQRSWLKRQALSQARKSVRAAGALRLVVLMPLPESCTRNAEVGGKGLAAVTIL